MLYRDRSKKPNKLSKNRSTTNNSNKQFFRYKNRKIILYDISSIQSISVKDHTQRGLFFKNIIDIKSYKSNSRNSADNTKGNLDKVSEARDRIDKIYGDIQNKATQFGLEVPEDIVKYRGNVDLLYSRYKADNAKNKSDIKRGILIVFRNIQHKIETYYKQGQEEQLGMKLRALVQKITDTVDSLRKLGISIPDDCDERIKRLQEDGKNDKIPLEVRKAKLGELESLQNNLTEIGKTFDGINTIYSRFNDSATKLDVSAPPYTQQAFERAKTAVITVFNELMIGKPNLDVIKEINKISVYFKHIDNIKAIFDTIRKDYDRLNHNAVIFDIPISEDLKEHFDDAKTAFRQSLSTASDAATIDERSRELEKIHNYIIESIQDQRQQLEKRLNEMFKSIKRK